MKRSVLIVALTIAGSLSMASVLTFSGYQVRGDNSPKVKQVMVNAQTIVKLPAGGKYVVDLTRKGTVYEFDRAAGPIGFQRVVVRTSTGEQPFSGWLEKTFSKKALTGRESESFRLGAITDFRKLWGSPPTIRTPRSGPPAFICDFHYCTCDGDPDCFDLEDIGLCGDWWRCRGGGRGEPPTQCICERRS